MESVLVVSDNIDTLEENAEEIKELRKVQRRFLRDLSNGRFPGVPGLALKRLIDLDRKEKSFLTVEARPLAIDIIKELVKIFGYKKTSNLCLMYISSTHLFELNQIAKEEEEKKNLEERKEDESTTDQPE